MLPDDADAPMMIARALRLRARLMPPLLMLYAMLIMPMRYLLMMLLMFIDAADADAMPLMLMPARCLFDAAMLMMLSFYRLLLLVDGLLLLITPPLRHYCLFSRHYAMPC